MKLTLYTPGFLITCGHPTFFHLCVLDNLRHIQFYDRLILRRKTGWKFLWCGKEGRLEKWIIERHYNALVKSMLDDDEEEYDQQ